MAKKKPVKKPAKKRTRKGTTKKRHKPRLERTADKLLAFYESPETTLRQAIRAAVADMRVIGDRDTGSIDVGARARQIAWQKCEEQLQAVKSPKDLAKCVRSLNVLERHRHADRKAELEFAGKIADAHLAETTLRVQAAIDNIDDDSGTPEAVTRRLADGG